MEVILKETIETLGQLGEIVKVKAGYARNYLLPRQLAVTADKGNLARREQDRASIQAKLEKQRQETDALAKKLTGVTIVIEQRVGDADRLFGSVTAGDLADKLADLGFEIDRKKILLADPIKNLGEFTVKIKIGYQKTAAVTVRVQALTEA